jgi:hypothetical protein
LRPIVLLRRSLPLLLALPTLRSLLLFALLVFNSLLLLTLAPLSLLFLLALPALGPLDVVVLTLTLDLLRALALRTLDGAPLGSPFGSRLATFDTGCGSLRCRRTRSLTGCTTLATTVMLAFLTAVLRLSKTRARSSAEQQYACRSGNQSSVHLEHSCWADGCAPCTARRTFPEPNACNRPVFRCETEEIANHEHTDLADGNPSFTISCSGCTWNYLCQDCFLSSVLSCMQTEESSHE